MTGVVRYRLTYSLTLDEQVDDLLRSWRAFGTVATQRKVAILVGVLLTLLLYIVWQKTHINPIAAPIAGALVGLMLLMTVERRLRRNGRQVLGKINGHESPIEMVIELTDSEVILRRPDDQQIWRWSAIRSVDQDADAIRLMTSRYTLLNLPARSFRTAREEEECLAFLKQKLSMNGLPQH
jgi:hypothetical protein